MASRSCSNQRATRSPVKILMTQPTRLCALPPRCCRHNIVALLVKLWCKGLEKHECALCAHRWCKYCSGPGVFAWRWLEQCDVATSARTAFCFILLPGP